MFSSYSHLDLRCEKQIDILTLRKSHFMLSYFHYAYVVAVFLLSVKLGHFLTSCNIIEVYTMSGILTEKSRRVSKGSVDAIVGLSIPNI